MTDEEKNMLEEKAKRGLDRIEAILEESRQNDWEISWEDYTIIFSFLTAFLGEPPHNKGDAYKRGNEIMREVLMADLIGHAKVEEDGKTRRRKKNFPEESADTMAEFAKAFRDMHEETITDKDLLLSSLAYVSLYLRSMKGDEQALNKSLEILGEDRMAEALEIYNQGLNFHDINDPEGADSMREFMVKNIAYLLRSIKRYNAFLLGIMKREELDDLSFLACFYVDESALNLNLYKEGLDNLKKEIKVDREAKLQTLGEIFPEITEEEASFEKGDSIIFNPNRNKEKETNIAINKALRKAKSREFYIYVGTLLR